MVIAYFLYCNSSDFCTVFTFFFFFFTVFIHIFTPWESVKVLLHLTGLVNTLILPSLVLNRLRRDDRRHCRRHHRHSCRIADHPKDVQQVGLHSCVTWQ